MEARSPLVIRLPPRPPELLSGGEGLCSSGGAADLPRFVADVTETLYAAVLVFALCATFRLAFPSGGRVSLLGVPTGGRLTPRPTLPL